jgi:hypothetical protein
VLLGDERPRRLPYLKCVFAAPSSYSVRPKDLPLRYHSSRAGTLRCVPKCRDTLCRETGSHYGRPEMLPLNPVKT